MYAYAGWSFQASLNALLVVVCAAAVPGRREGTVAVGALHRLVHCIDCVVWCMPFPPAAPIALLFAVGVRCSWCWLVLR